MANISNRRTRLSKKRSRESDEDLISKLPDSLLQHVCSFVSTRDAVRTSLLSRRWQNLWKLVPCLDLDSRQFYSKDDFYNFMDRFFDLRGNSDIYKFKVKYYFTKRQSAHFKSWINAAIKCKVEHLEIENVRHYGMSDSVDDGLGMPPSLCICNTLVVLKVNDVDNFDIPESVSLTNLKIMHLNNIKFANDIAFKILISGCPVLEELNIVREYEDNIVVLCICSLTLKQLIIVFQVLEVDYGIEYGIVIDAPNLEYLTLDDLDSKSFKITNIGSSLKARLNVQFGISQYYELANDFSLRSSIGTLFTGICNARTLIIDLETFELLCQYKRFEALLQFHNLIHLEAKFSKDACKVLPAILECCPNLKFLILDLVSSSECPPLRSHPVAPKPMLSSLESITMQMPINGNATEMNLIKYFLRKSRVLKEMKVNLSKDLNPKEESLILKKLLMFPRRSKACQFHVE